MNKEEYLLSYLVEECSKVIQAVEASKRFGLDLKNRKGIKSAVEYIFSVGDLLAEVETFTPPYNRENVRGRKDYIREAMRRAIDTGIISL